MSALNVRLSLFLCVNQCREACCLTGTHSPLTELSMWSAWQPPRLITDNSIPHRNTEVAPLVPSPPCARHEGCRCPWQPRGRGGAPPLPPLSSAQLVAPLKSTDLSHCHLHSHCLLITTTNVMRNVRLLGSAPATCRTLANFQCRK